MSELDADVLVVGAGGAGLAAALAAAERGLSVLLAEGRENFRSECNTFMSTAMIPAGGSRWQKTLGIEDSPALFYDDIMRKTKGAAYAVVAKALTTVAPELVAWLADRWELPLALATDFDYPGHSRQRCHTVPDRSGETLHRLLVDAATAQDNVTLAAPLALRELAIRAADRATAILVSPDGHEETVDIGAVVLAAGGFGGNTELVRRNIPEIANALYFGSPGNDGTAIRLGQTLGADLGYLDAYQGHGSVATPTGIMVTWASVMHGAVILNAAGERFDDETQGYSEYAEKVIAQPGSVAWLVLDERIDRLCRPFADYARLVEADAIRWHEDLAGVARQIGADPAAVARTFERAGTFADGAAGDLFGRRIWEAPLMPPMGVVKITGALFHTQGGLLVDERAHVLRHGEPIANLFAAGGSAAGMSGHGAAGYLAGNGLLAALGLGYLAGRAVASVPAATM